MTLENKQDPVALLRRWPALSPSKERGVFEHEDTADWEARADVIVRAAIAAGPSDEGALGALDAPPLPLEPGEPSEPERASAGETKMSQENESGGPRAAGGSVAPPDRKRTSLKSIAERANQSGARPSAAPPASAARSSVPGAVASSPTNSRPGLSSRPGMSSRPPIEPDGDDSGVIDLSAGHVPAAPPRAIAAAAAPESAQPVASRPADSAPATVKAAAAAVGPAEVIAIAPRAAAKKGNGGMIAGVAIAVCGIAAAFAIMQTQQRPAATTATLEAKPTAAAVAQAPAQPPGNEKPAGELAAAEPAPAPSAEGAAGPDSKPSAPKAGGAVALQPTGAPASAPVAVAGKGAAAGDKAAPAKEPGKPGDLASEMARAVGSDGQPKDDSAGTPEPAAGNPKSQSIPEQPSQGSVSSWKNAVIGSAKACVGGADDVSRATVTFASDGSVSSVSVSGWAADNGKAECIKSALKSANVGPFSKSSFTVGLPIRP